MIYIDTRRAFWSRELVFTNLRAGDGVERVAACVVTIGEAL